jgi:lysozyme family protein
MVDDFEKCLEFVLKMEGGFSDNPDDHGGATNFGIIQTEYDRFRRANGLACQSVRFILQTEVRAIYKASYWSEIHGDYVEMPLCMVLFDTAVNNGVGRAIEFLNEYCGLGKSMVWTAQTSSIYHEWNLAKIKSAAVEIIKLRREFYERIAQNPGQHQFLEGWLNRLNSLAIVSNMR